MKLLQQFLLIIIFVIIWDLLSHLIEGDFKNLFKEILKFDFYKKVLIIFILFFLLKKTKLKIKMFRK